MHLLISSPRDGTANEMSTLWLLNNEISCKKHAYLVVLVVGPLSTAAMKAYCTLTPLEFRHSYPEALHTKRRERPLLANDGTKAKEFS
jgi:hypothetical protein